MAIENENEIAEWMKTYEALPEERRELVQRWFATQKIIIDNAGISADEWFRYVQWAMDNPFDYAFVQGFADKPDAVVSADSAAESDETRAARKLVGADAKKAPLMDGPGMKDKAKSDKGLEKELFNRFLSNQIKGRK
ncbi:hypothetical protein L6R52_31375 [Myxococcota bacterium]|nr:hypothetical protein [Myxococcota bacterium]